MKISELASHVLGNQNLKSEDRRQTSQTASKTESLEYYKEALHVEIDFGDGSSMSLDWAYEALSKKTEYEITNFSNFTYGDDYFSADNTAGRILEFARSLWDGSSEQLDILAKAIDTGVSEARDILGEIPGWVGDLISSTEEKLHKGLEEMRQETAAVAEPSAEDQE